MTREPKPSDLSPADVRIGEAVARFRHLAKQSQTVTAIRMKDRGFKWTAVTVLNIEKGRRSLRGPELVELAAVFGVSVEALCGPDLDRREFEYGLRHILWTMEEESGKLAQATRDWIAVKTAADERMGKLITDYPEMWETFHDTELLYAAEEIISLRLNDIVYETAVQVVEETTPD